MSSSWIPDADFGINTGGVFGGGGAPNYSGVFGGGSSSAGTNWGGVLGPLGRIAGGIFDVAKTAAGDVGPGAINMLFSKQAVKQLEKQQKQYLNDIFKTFNRIGDLTGRTPEKAVDRYEKVFKNYMNEAYAQGRQDLEADQALGGQYFNRLEDAIGRSTDYSLMRNPMYRDAYTAPNAVAPVNVGAIKDVMTLDASDPAQFKKMSFAQPESQSFIYGRPDAISQYAAFFSSKPTQDLMKYTV